MKSQSKHTHTCKRLPMNRFLTGDLRILMIRYTLNQWLLALKEVRTIFKDCFSERLKEYYMELKAFIKQAEPLKFG